jgi:hypothetical protein
MPGYKPLPQQYDGFAAEQVRLAEALQRAGASEEAAHLLEAALEVCAAAKPELPGWLCGRLAAVYRALKRYDDEVMLLTRYPRPACSHRFAPRSAAARPVQRERRTFRRTSSASP